VEPRGADADAGQRADAYTCSCLASWLRQTKRRRDSIQIRRRSRLDSVAAVVFVAVAVAVAETYSLQQ
jgi:hypothetical protein